MDKAIWLNDAPTGFLGLKVSDAQVALERIFTLNLTFLVFTFGSLLVATQVAGGQYSPRIITTLLRNNVIRFIVGLFVFTMLWANRTLPIPRLSDPKAAIVLPPCSPARSIRILLLLCCLAGAHAAESAGAGSGGSTYLFNDSHLHLTNYVQEGTNIHEFMKIMGDKIGRSTLFGIPLQQTWSYENSGDYAPTYYLQTDAPLYYYSFTDAFIAMAYRSLRPEEQQRLDPMITGFNPADMYAADHIRRVLLTFPGVFTGIGEFTIHKEFVSGKVAGPTASLTDPALDRILDFAAEAGLVVILHCDIDMPFAKPGPEPVYLKQVVALLKRHPKTTIIWAHTGLGRVVAPTQSQAVAGIGGYSPTHIEIVKGLLADAALEHVYFDISWDEVAKYATSSPETERKTAQMFNEYPDRFLFGTDNVAPKDQAEQLRVFHLWDRIFAQLSSQTSLAIRRGNYGRLFDAARLKVRAWEKQHAK